MTLQFYAYPLAALLIPVLLGRLIVSGSRKSWVWSVPVYVILTVCYAGFSNTLSNAAIAYSCLISISVLLVPAFAKTSFLAEYRFFSLAMTLLLLWPGLGYWNLTIHPLIQDAAVQKATIVSCCFLLAGLECSGVMACLLKWMNVKLISYPHRFKNGRSIGIIERLLIIFFVMADGMSAVGLIVAAKGIVRFKEIQSDKDADYVLIGTLISTLLGVILGLAAKSL